MDRNGNRNDSGTVPIIEVLLWFSLVVCFVRGGTNMLEVERGLYLATSEPILHSNMSLSSRLVKTSSTGLLKIVSLVHSIVIPMRLHSRPRHIDSRFRVSLHSLRIR